MEKKMVDRLIHERIPKSAAEYITCKAMEGTLFHIPNRSRESAMQDHINKEAEKKYDPSFLEQAASAIGSWLINAATTLGVGGLIGQAAIDGSVEAVDRVGSGQQKDFLERQRKLGRQEVATANRNRALSIARARYIAKQFINNGIEKSQMKAVSLGGIHQFAPKEANRFAMLVMRE